MSEIIIDEMKCHYESYGDKGYDVVLLHGWGQNTLMMEYIGKFLAPHFRVFNLDFPGFGESDEPKTSFSVADYADWFAKFCDHLDIHNPILIGHSFGCRVALHYARNHEVRKMALTGAAGVKDKRGIDYYLRVYSYKAAKKVLSISPFKGQLEKLKKNAGSEDYRNASGVMRDTLVKVVNDDVSDFLKEIDVETLLIFGSNDEATPVEKGKFMEKEMPNATLIVFEGDDHYAYFHQADRFNAVLEAFLKRDYYVD